MCSTSGMAKETPARSIFSQITAINLDLKKKLNCLEVAQSEQKQDYSRESIWKKEWHWVIWFSCVFFKWLKPGSKLGKTLVGIHTFSGLQNRRTKFGIITVTRKLGRYSKRKEARMVKWWSPKSWGRGIKKMSTFLADFETRTHRANSKHFKTNFKLQQRENVYKSKIIAC